MEGLRKELKYIISYTDYHVLKGILGNILKKDQNVLDETGGYHIRSLYFDDIYDSALFEKNFGVHTRKKFRIRIYNKCDSVIKLEKKMKMDNYNKKSSVSFNRSQFIDVIEGNVEWMRSLKSPTSDEFYMEYKIKGLRPKVVVDYFREAYVMDASDVRITFDKDLRAARGTFEIFDDLMAHQVLNDGQMIFEVKYNEFLPEIIKLALGYLDRKPLAVSKYVLCREFFNSYDRS